MSDFIPAPPVSVASFPRRSKYDWDTILNGECWKLTRGEQFPQSKTTEAFRHQVADEARARGLKLRTAVQGNVLHVQAEKAE